MSLQHSVRRWKVHQTAQANERDRGAT
jgi:hypothetical protein